MLDDALHEPLAQSAPAMRFQHKNIAEVGHGGEVADHAGKSDLRIAAFIDAEAQRVLYRPRDDFPRNTLGPIAIRQKTVNHIQIEPLTVGADQELTAPVLGNRGYDDGL